MPRSDAHLGLVFRRIVDVVAAFCEAHVILMPLFVKCLLFAQSFDESLQTMRGSVPWMAPEMVKQTGHGRSADVWSLGATMIEMYTARYPWPAFSNNIAAMYHVATCTEVSSGTRHGYARIYSTYASTVVCIMGVQQSLAQKIVRNFSRSSSVPKYQMLCYMYLLIVGVMGVQQMK